MASSQFDSYNNNTIDGRRDGNRISPSFLSQEEIPLRNLGAPILPPPPPPSRHDRCLTLGRESAWSRPNQRTIQPLTLRLYTG